jgi:hypothetical protein
VYAWAIGVAKRDNAVAEPPNHLRTVDNPGAPKGRWRPDR